MHHTTTAANLPNPFLDDSVQISGWQRRLHFYSELAAILMVPKLFSAARDAGPKHKGFLTFLAWGTLAVDGYLLYKWLSDERLMSQQQRVTLARDAAQTIKRPPPVGPGAPPAPPRQVKVVIGRRP